MYQMLFKSRWMAALFVATIAYSAVAFVSDGSREDTLVQAAADLRGPVSENGKSAGGETRQDQPASSNEQRELAFTPDDELIDDAAGFDPNPMENFTQDRDDPAEVHDTGPDMDEYGDAAGSDPEENF